MATDDSPANRGRRKEDSKKLTKVLSTKLSAEGYKVFRILTKHAYRNGKMNHDSPSEMLRYVMTPVVEGFRLIPGFSLLKTKPHEQYAGQLLLL